jgi:hypothetical protein
MSKAIRWPDEGPEDMAKRLPGKWLDIDLAVLPWAEYEQMEAQIEKLVAARIEDNKTLEQFQSDLFVAQGANILNAARNKEQQAEIDRLKAEVERLRHVIVCLKDQDQNDKIPITHREFMMLSVEARRKIMIREAEHFEPDED